MGGQQASCSVSLKHLGSRERENELQEGYTGRMAGPGRRGHHASLPGSALGPPGRCILTRGGEHPGGFAGPAGGWMLTHCLCGSHGSPGLPQRAGSRAGPRVPRGPSAFSISEALPAFSQSRQHPRKGAWALWSKGFWKAHWHKQGRTKGSWMAKHLQKLFLSLAPWGSRSTGPGPSACSAPAPGLLHPCTCPRTKWKSQVWGIFLSAPVCLPPKIE